MGKITDGFVVLGVVNINAYSLFSGVPVNKNSSFKKMVPDTTVVSRVAPRQFNRQSLSRDIIS
jgi:hypothetical protein